MSVARSGWDILNINEEYNICPSYSHLIYGGHNTNGGMKESNYE
jgi:hypothetical protein